MTMGAKEVLLFTVPVSGSLAVDAHFPVAQLVSMALAAKAVRFGEGYDLPGNQTQVITVVKIVAV